MLASTIESPATSFTVKETVTGNNVPGVVTYNATTRIATFTPTANLTSGLNYTATITTAAKDAAGNALAVDKVWSFTVDATLCAASAPSVNLGLASTFGIAARSGLTSTGVVVVNGNVALSPTGTCTDATGVVGNCLIEAGPVEPLGLTVVGSIRFPTDSDAGVTAANVMTDLTAAFLSITPPAGPPAVGSLGGAGNIPAGTTLGAVTGSALVLGDNYFTPGVYQSLTEIIITGDLTLDAQGDPDARFVFQSSSTTKMADGGAGVYSRILLVNGAKASNVWWQVGSSATLGLYSEFQGNILASATIVMNTGATSCGRLLAGAFTTGQFTFDSNVVSVPGQTFAPGGTRSAVCQ